MHRFFLWKFFNSSEQLFIAQPWIAAPCIVDFIENIWNFGVAMKQSENRILSMILLRRVVFLKNINLHESHWLYTYVEIFLNLMGFTDFFYKEILTKLISFSSRYTFPLDLLLKAGVVLAKNYEFLHFFLRGKPYWFRDISQISELKFIRKTSGKWFIHFDRLCNYLHSFQKQPAWSGTRWSL